MLKEERQQLILDLLTRNGKVVASDLSRKFKISEDTIRRDLRELADAGQLLRVHGGGMPHSPASAPFVERLQQAPAAKKNIAHTALQLVHDGQVILVDGGTTNLSVTQQLPVNLQATVITNSPLIAVEAARLPRVEVIQIGGRVYKDSLVTSGAVTVEAIRGIHVDLCLLGVCSLHPDLGVTVPDLEEAQVKQAMITAADRVAALASAEKLGTAATHIVAPISALTYLITDASVTDEVLDSYRASGVTVLVR
jgi:DeoR/GlpR family transcriptional regulator of sugar metabolism